MDPDLIVIDAPTEAVREAILAPLSAFNADAGYPPDWAPLVVALRDEAGGIVGGLWGKTVYDWMFIDYLAVPDGLRGRKLGAGVMRTAEEIALSRGCVGAWLTTFSFQAQGFYEKQGYEVFASLERSPRENTRIFLRKQLKP